MASVGTTRMSSKGQVVIPEDVRNALGLEVGEHFVVMGDGDSVVLKRIAVPAKRELRALIARVRAKARRAGIQRGDVGEAIRRVRQTTRLTDAQAERLRAEPAAERRPNRPRKATRRPKR
jgi:AbrB family looped-hinge helix DNA binding protein